LESSALGSEKGGVVDKLWGRTRLMLDDDIIIISLLIALL
jgi:hypothetical protein